MNISEIRDGMLRVETEGVIKEISPSRKVTLRTGGEAEVADMLISDGKASIKVNLWDDQINEAKVGKTAKIVNGYTNSFRGEVRVNIGRYGTLAVE